MRLTDDCGCSQSLSYGEFNSETIKVDHVEIKRIEIEDSMIGDGNRK